MTDGGQPTFCDKVSVHYAQLFRDLSPETCGDLEHFVQWAQAHPLRSSLLNQTRLPVWWHESLFQEFMLQCPHVQPKTLSVLRLLSQHKRLPLLSTILQRLQHDRAPEMVLYWQTAQLLSPADLDAFAALLEKHFQRPVVLRQTLRPQLVLGGVLLWNDHMLDLSLYPVFSTLYREAIHATSPS